MARKVTTRSVWISTAAAWLFGFLIFLPILWMVLTSFKTELEAFSMPPKFLLFHWTTENYATVQERSDYVHHALNSIIIAGGSTLIAMIIAIPAAYMAGNKWLQNYPYRITLNWWLFALAAVSVVMIALVTVSFQAIKAAVANPAKSLRTE